MHPCYAHGLRSLALHIPNYQLYPCNQIDLRSAGERSHVRRLAFEPPPNDKEDKDKGSTTSQEDARRG